MRDHPVIGHISTRQPQKRPPSTWLAAPLRIQRLLSDSIEIGDQIGAVFGLGQTGKTHLGARREFLGVF